MDLKIAVPEFSKALQRVQGVIEKKTTMPILANVLIETSGKSEIRVSATNLEIGVSGNYPAEVLEEGAITLSGKALYDIVRALPEDSLSLKRESNNWVALSSGKTNYRVVGMAAEGFPSLPKFDEVEFFEVDAKAFRRMIDRTLYSVSTDETRYNLTGVYCEAMAEPPGLRMVSTDGHRLSIIEAPISGVEQLKKGVIIPRKGVIELRKLLEDGEGPGRLGFVENSAVFEKAGVTMTMQLLEGQFPDYEKVIPPASTRTLKVPRDRLQAALKRTSLLSPDKAQGVRLELEPGVLALSANNPDLGEAREELEVDYDGEGLKIGFNFRYLIDVLSAIDTQEVELGLNDALSPCVVRGVGEEDYRAIVMPMRL